MCNVTRSTTNQHDVEMMKVLITAIPPILQALTAPVTHNHYHHQVEGNSNQSNPYRSANTVAELEQLLLAQPKTLQRENILKHLAKFPESMPVDRVPMPTNSQSTVKLLR